MACIPTQLTKRLKKVFQTGELNADEFLAMTSDEREKALSRFMEEKYAKNVNNIVVKKFNTELSEDMVEDIFKKYSKIEELRGAEKPLTLNEWKDLKTPPKWAKEYIEINNKIDDIINVTNRMKASETTKYIAKESLRKITDKETIFGKTTEVGKMAYQMMTSAIYKSVKASFDMSYALRQGYKVMTKSPTTWKKSFMEAWNVWKNIGSKEKMNIAMSEFKAKYMAHPYYETLVDDGKLAFGVVEEFFPTTLVQKIPALGNIFKASDEAFTVFSQSARMGLATDIMEKQMLKTGGLTKDQVKSIATLANSITGRGGLGKLEMISPQLNKLFFSARFVRSQIDTFAMPFNPKMTPFVRKEATKHLVSTLGTTGALLATASMFTEVGLDPRSSSFGKAKVGENTWIDLTAGLGSHIVLATKQATGQTKSATTGKVTKLNDPSAYKGQTRGDVLAQWATNKLAPAPGALNALFLKGRDFSGKKPTALSMATSLGVPISIENIIDLMQDEEGAVIVGAWVADLLGMSAQTYKR